MSLCCYKEKNRAVYWVIVQVGGNGFPQEQITGGLEVSVGVSDIKSSATSLPSSLLTVHARKNSFPYITT